MQLLLLLQFKQSEIDYLKIYLVLMCYHIIVARGATYILYKILILHNLNIILKAQGTIETIRMFIMILSHCYSTKLNLNKNLGAVVAQLFRWAVAFAMKKNVHLALCHKFLICVILINFILCSSRVSREAC